MNRRQYCTPREKLAILERQGYTCSCGCGRPIWPVHRIDWEHTLALGLGGQGKPDAAMLHSCHGPKTAVDVKMIRKADRQKKAHNGTKPKSGRKLQSRGFNKTLTRGFDGKVRKREDPAPIS